MKDGKRLGDDSDVPSCKRGGANCRSTADLKEACAASLGGRHEVARRETDARAEAFEDGARVIERARIDAGVRLGSRCGPPGGCAPRARRAAARDRGRGPARVVGGGAARGGPLVRAGGRGVRGVRGALLLLRRGPSRRALPAHARAPRPARRRLPAAQHPDGGGRGGRGGGCALLRRARAPPRSASCWRARACPWTSRRCTAYAGPSNGWRSDPPPPRRSW